MRHFIFRSLVLGSLALAACVAPDQAEQVNEASSDLAAAELQGDDAQVFVREAYRSDEGQVLEQNFGLAVTPAASVSFWQTCRPYKYFIVSSSTGRIIEAYSDSCQRRNGTWGGPTFWSGSCSSDVANCNGALRCGGC